MADKKTSDETAASTLTGAELIRGVQSGASVKVTVNQIRDYVQGALTALAIATGTITTSTPAIAATQTWNAGGVTFTALKLNVTDTASASGSLLMDLQVGGSSVLSATKTGRLVSTSTGFSGSGNGGAFTWPGGTIGSSSGTPFFQSGNGSLWFGFGGSTPIVFSGLGGSGTQIAIASNTGTLALGLSSDVILSRDAANTLALQNGTSAQTLNIYNTWSSAGANYERGSIGFATPSNGSLAFTINGGAAGGTGTGRELWLKAANNIYLGGSAGYAWTVNNSGHFLTGADNTYDIGASGANRPRAIYCAGTISSSGVSIGSHVAIPAANFVSWGSRGAIKSPADKVITLTDNAGTGPAIANTGQFTVAGLPSAASYAGSMAFVSDANATTARSTVAGGGSNKVMVMSDGTNWLIVA